MSFYHFGCISMCFICDRFLENLVNKRRQAAESSSTAGTQAQSFSGLGHTSSGLPHSVTTNQLSTVSVIPGSPGARED